ncbi:hypothetical protein [Dermabacter hominis]|uniref:hypothetical protein n=1 Tax=Dermabacter hominis TaxID=36740 RepID=UPI0021A4F91E|nr:hypothetical protein [Dermabacter hominis]MCT1790601.1 hypothetical protein [Dermabacter hominis]
MENVKVSELLAERTANRKEIVGIQTWLRANRHAHPHDRYTQAARVRELQQRQRDIGEMLDSSLLRHGTNAGYQRGCRCESCRAANRDYMRTYRGGPKPTAYADPPTAHVRALLESGWKQVDLCRVSGISCRTFSRISNSRVQRVLATTANALLAIEPKGTNK